MMIRTAGGPGLVNPIDFHERRTPRFSRTTWIAVAVVAAGHVGLGAALYYQRFEMPLPDPQRPQPPNTRVNELPAPPRTPDVVAVTPGETVAEGSTITLVDSVPEPVEHAPPVKATPQPPAVITNPRWERQPSAEQLMRAYPDRALRAEAGGRVSLNCLVQPNGRVADCRVTNETPGYGFGEAAQRLTRHFQISPRTVDGAAVGSRVNIAIRFTPPAD